MALFCGSVLLFLWAFSSILWPYSSTLWPCSSVLQVLFFCSSGPVLLFFRSCSSVLQVLFFCSYGPVLLFLWSCSFVLRPYSASLWLVLLFCGPDLLLCMIAVFVMFCVLFFWIPSLLGSRNLLEWGKDLPGEILHLVSLIKYQTVNYPHSNAPDPDLHGIRIPSAPGSGSVFRRSKKRLNERKKLSRILLLLRISETLFVYNFLVLFFLISKIWIRIPIRWIGIWNPD
jgi:hypothetical protein